VLVAGRSYVDDDVAVDVERRRLLRRHLERDVAVWSARRAESVKGGGEGRRERAVECERKEVDQCLGSIEKAVAWTGSAEGGRLGRTSLTGAQTSSHTGCIDSGCGGNKDDGLMQRCGDAVMTVSSCSEEPKVGGRIAGSL
jgi:hypothetical protein